MKRVALCDDDPLQLREAAQAVKAHAQAEGLELEITTYPDVDSLLADIARPGNAEAFPARPRAATAAKPATAAVPAKPAAPAATLKPTAPAAPAATLKPTKPAAPAAPAAHAATALPATAPSPAKPAGPDAPAAPDVLFMDIEFQGEPRGIQATERINRLAPDCQVVYLTNYLQYTLDVYHTSHAWYVLKSQFTRRLPEIFRKLLAMEEARRDKLVVQTRDGGIVRVPSARILYLERRERSTFIHVPDGVHEVRGKIPDLLAMLPEGGFSRCHYSFAANLAQVARMDAADLVLADGTKLPISRRFAKGFRDDYLRWAATWTV